jgi:hypothetical protein
VSINDLVKEEAQRQIDLAIEEIPSDRNRLSTPIARSRFQYKNISDFLLGFEYGHITRDVCVLLPEPGRTKWTRSYERGSETGD